MVARLPVGEVLEWCLGKQSQEDFDFLEPPEVLQAGMYSLNLRKSLLDNLLKASTWLKSASSIASEAL